MKIIFYKNIEEDPVEDFDILERNEFEYNFDKNLLVKDFLCNVFNKYCHKCSYDDICVDMVMFYKREFDEEYRLKSIQLNEDVIKVFKYEIENNDPIIMVNIPEYMGGGCYGESRGLRYYINSNEDIHEFEPHIHVQTYSNQFKDRFFILDCSVMPTKNNKFPLSNSLRKVAMKFIKERQIYFLEMWNTHTNCKNIVNINKFKDDGIIEFIKKI